MFNILLVITLIVPCNTFENSSFASAANMTISMPSLPFSYLCESHGHKHKFIYKRTLTAHACQISRDVTEFLGDQGYFTEIAHCPINSQATTPTHIPCRYTLTHNFHTHGLYNSSFTLNQRYIAGNTCLNILYTQFYCWIKIEKEQNFTDTGTDTIIQETGGCFIE